MDYSADTQYKTILHKLVQHMHSVDSVALADRTGVGTYALWSETARFDLSGGHVPLLTLKRVPWKMPIQEMIWFLSGNPSIKPLLEQNIHIWTANVYDQYKKIFIREFGEDFSMYTEIEFAWAVQTVPGFEEKYGRLKFGYGEMWRSFPYSENGEEKAFDQISDVINLIRTNPTSRRIIFHGWHPAFAAQATLPPCHTYYQFQVTHDGKLNALLVCRSQDYILGTPFNWMGAAVLTKMIAKITGYTPGELVWLGADTHLYANHVKQAYEILERDERMMPRLIIHGDQKEIDDFKIEDFEIVGYDPHPPIKAVMAV